MQGTTGVNVARPVLNANSFGPQFLQPGQAGVPACDASGVCDTFESIYGNSRCNLFRGLFQLRFDASLGKMFDITDREKARFSWDAYKVFNSAGFDTPNSNVTFFPDYGPPTSFPPVGQLGIIQHTIGSFRFVQLSLHILF